MLAVALAATLATAAAAVTAPAGYIYSSQLLSSPTQSCVAAGPGGTFVAVGPGFTANAQSVVLAKESGELRLVASGFNSISDCAYDAGNDVLYVTDNADNGDFGIASPLAAQSGDTVFAIGSASTASGLTAPDVELLPPDSIPSAASVAVDTSGNVFVSNSAGGGTGSLIKIVGSSPSTLVSGLDFAAGLAFNPANGNLFSAESLASFAVEINQYSPAGAPVPPAPFAGPSFSLGSYDLAFNSDGRLLVSGAFAGDVLSFNPADSTSVPFVSGLNFATGIAVDPFTHRVQILSSTFSPTPANEDKSLHRFTPIDQLSPGRGPSRTECLHEAYGLQVVDGIAACTDGAPCDGDGQQNDACLFPIGFCFNVDDPNFTTCDTTGTVTDVTISARPASAAIATTARQIAATLPFGGSSCFFSDGYWVPLVITGAGAKQDGEGTVNVKVKVKVQAITGDGKKDTDRLKLVCHPAP
jgi:hypothetical protein